MNTALLLHLADFLDAHSDERPNVPILQPADPFLDTVGEEMRRRLFVSEGADGRALCLRPEFTIPLCLHYVERDALGQQTYSCAGTVFRQERAGAQEFEQVGIEMLGHLRGAHADADALKLFHELLREARHPRAKVTLGDKALFRALAEAIGLTDGWVDRLLRAFGRPDALEAALEQLAAPPVETPDDDVHRLAAKGDRTALELRVRELMKAGGMSPEAGRTPAAVAHRMIERERDRAVRLDPFGIHTLRAFLGIDMALPDALDAVTTLADATGLDLDEALRNLRERLALLQETVDAERLTFRAGFGRALDYYTGLLFEAEDDGVALGGGGRYDKLCTALGAETPAPAVGFSLAVDRIAGR